MELQSKNTAENSVEGSTDLHNEVLASCKTPETYSWFIYNDINRLMTQTTKLNMPKTKGYTAVECAVEYPNKEIVEHMLNHPSADHLHLDYYP